MSVCLFVTEQLQTYIFTECDKVALGLQVEFDVCLFALSNSRATLSIKDQDEIAQFSSYKR